MSYDRDDVQAAEALHAHLAKTPIYELLLQYAELIDKRLSAMDTVDSEVYDFFSQGLGKQRHYPYGHCDP